MSCDRSNCPASDRDRRFGLYSSHHARLDPGRARAPSWCLPVVRFQSRERTSKPQHRRCDPPPSDNGGPTQRRGVCAFSCRSRAPARPGPCPLQLICCRSTSTGGLADGGGGRSWWRPIPRLDRCARLPPTTSLDAGHRDQDIGPRPRRNRTDARLVRAGILDRSATLGLASDAGHRLPPAARDRGR
jgi:hypothetical protein